MSDFYRIPALSLLLLLLPAFAYLYRRYRNTRTLLWLLGFLFAAVRMSQLTLADYLGAQKPLPPLVLIAGIFCAHISSAFFLASLSPQRLHWGRIRLLYVFIVPVTVCSLLAQFTDLGYISHAQLPWFFLPLACVAAAATLDWGARNGAIPGWVGFGSGTLVAAAAFWICFTQGTLQSTHAIDSFIHIMTALLVLFVFRRFSPGVLLTIAGFLVWSTMLLQNIPFVQLSPAVHLLWLRFVIMSKVVAAMGMILLTLEDELIAKKKAQEGERSMRLQMEAYTRLLNSHHKLAEFDSRTSELCHAVTSLSRFHQAALMVGDGLGRFRLAGSSGFEPAVASALSEAASHLPVAGFLAPGSVPLVLEPCTAVRLDLKSWLQPGSDLIRLRATSFLAIPLSGREGADGALLLSGFDPANGCKVPMAECLPLREDLLPLELLVSRFEEARSRTLMLEKLIHAEKFASVGQLAQNVTHQLNNPLTVILGYAALLESQAGEDTEQGRFISAILAQARLMKTTLESLTRVSSSRADQWASVSVTEILADLERLHRTEFLQHSIDFRMNIAPDLPQVRCHAQQIRQAIQHCLRYGLEAVGNSGAEPVTDRVIHMEASCEGRRLQIMLSHSGPGFADPGQAFEPMAQQHNLAESGTLGLSLCSSIMRENNGSLSAINLEPRGAAIIMELQVA